MHLCRPIRGPRPSLTTCGMCRSAHHSRNSRSFCTYKIASHLHISQPLKVPQFQCFAPKSYLTSFVCADARMGRGGPPRRNANANPLVGSHCVFSRLHTPNLQPTHFQQITHSGGWGGYPCRPPRIDRRHESNPCVFKPLCNTPPPIAFVFKGLRNYEREGGYSSTFNENRCRFYGREKREHGAKQLLFFTTPTRPATSGRA